MTILGGATTFIFLKFRHFLTFRARKYYLNMYIFFWLFIGPIFKILIALQPALDPAKSVNNPAWLSGCLAVWLPVQKSIEASLFQATCKIKLLSGIKSSKSSSRKTASSNKKCFFQEIKYKSSFEKNISSRHLFPVLFELFINSSSSILIRIWRAPIEKNQTL